MNLASLDTSAEAGEMQVRALARLGSEGRLRAAFDLSEAVREMRMAGLQAQRPGATERELVRLLVVEAHGTSSTR